MAIIYFQLILYLIQIKCQSASWQHAYLTEQALFSVSIADIIFLASLN